MTEDERYHLDRLLDALTLYGYEPDVNCKLDVRHLPEMSCWVVEVEIGGDTLLYELGPTKEATLMQAWQELPTVLSADHDLRV